MNDSLVMTKNYLIDDYFESQSMLLTNNNNNNFNNNNLSFNKCVTKLGDIVKNGRNGQTQPFAPNNQMNTNGGQLQTGRQRVRHYSQQQLANNWINHTLNRSAKQNHKDIDGMYRLISIPLRSHILSNNQYFNTSLVSNRCLLLSHILTIIETHLGLNPKNTENHF